jgi:cytochrome c553
MKKKLLAFSMALAFTGSATSIVHAEGSIKAGKEKAAACASCHGEDGNSMVSTFPKLAQQHESYLERQLKDFRDGVRKDPVMSPMAMPLSDEDIADISAYYASRRISENQLPVLDEDDEDEKPAAEAEKKEDPVQALIAQGSDLYRNGNLKRKISACIACHGPYGEGNKPAAFPALKSQHADYLIKALKDAKSGARINNMMNMIAQKMTDEEIKAVAYRISMMK